MAVDDLISSKPPPDSGALEKARLAAKAELAAHPTPRPWQRDALMILVCTLGIALLIGAVTFVAGEWTTALFAQRAIGITLILTLQLLGGVAAVAPKARAARFAAVAIAPLAFFMIVVLRGEGLPSTSPPWFCTLSHLGADLLPAFAVIAVLRRMAPDPLRAAVAGVCAGATGALMGELLCGQGAAHVLMFHLPAWLGIAAVSVIVSRRVRPLSYAP